MSVYKNNRGKWCYDIEWIHGDGRVQRIRKTSPVQTKVGAEREERKTRDALSDGTYGVKSGEDVPTVNDYWSCFIEWCKGERHKPQGIESKEKNFRAHISPLFGRRRLDSFSLEDQRSLRARCADKAASTYNGIASAINKMLAVAKEEQQFSSEPFHFKLIKIPEQSTGFYDHQTLDLLVAAARKVSTLAECIVLLGADAGLRRGEMLALTYAKCDFTSRRLTIDVAESVVKKKRHVGPTKGLNSRAIPMTGRLHDALKRHKRTGVQVLMGRNGPLRVSALKRVLRKVQKLAGVNDTGETHILRHTFCSHLAMRGVPIMSIRNLAGHRKLETTLKYMHLAPGETDRAIAELEMARQHHSPNGNLAATAAE